MPEPPAMLVGVAHGSRDRRAAVVIDALMAQVRARAGHLDIRTAYLGHAAPSVRQVLDEATAAGSATHVTVVPLLLTAAYHSKTDIPRLLPPGTGYAAPLGPDPALLDVLDRRLAEAGCGEPADTALVLAAAGSSDPEANATIARLAARWRRRRGWQAVVPAYASSSGPGALDPAAAVAALRATGAQRVAVATYLLAPGYFADKIRAGSLAAGADTVCAPLGAAPEIARIVLARYAEGRAAAGLAA